MVLTNNRQFHAVNAGGKGYGQYRPLMTVRTLAIRWIDLALILVSSLAFPKAGSACVRPQPTV